MSKELCKSCDGVLFPSAHITEDGNKHCFFCFDNKKFDISKVKSEIWLSEVRPLVGLAGAYY